MKQHITKKQWGEISEELQTKFWRAVTIVCDSHDAASGSEDCDCSNPSIGQMIEFIREHDEEPISHYYGDEINFTGLCYYGKQFSFELDDELNVDSLWEAVKEILEK